MRVKRVHLKTVLAALALLILPAMASAWFATLTGLGVSPASAWYEDDGKPRNSYEQQRHIYEKTGVDTYRHGPLPEAHQPSNMDRYNEYQRQQAEEDRQRQERMNRQNQDRHGYGQYRSPY